MIATNNNGLLLTYLWLSTSATSFYYILYCDQLVSDKYKVTRKKINYRRRIQSSISDGRQHFPLRRHFLFQIERRKCPRCPPSSQAQSPSLLRTQFWVRRPPSTTRTPVYGRRDPCRAQRTTAVRYLPTVVYNE